MKIIVFIIILIMPAIASTKKHDVALWLARSCVGEAGWEAYETNECAAIMHVYLKRADIYRQPLYRIVRKYSSAVKNHIKHDRQWIFQLNRKGKRPKQWPKNLSWKKRQPQWKKILHMADLFRDGRIEDPLPSALHYGGKMDTNLNPKHWTQIKKTGFKNMFYKIRTRQ
jgi:hypothetical protein